MNEIQQGADWLSNPWFVGIVTGLLSGVLVFFITRWMFSDPSKREYRQKIFLANQEVVYAIRQGIPEGEVASAAVIKSLIKSTSRKYGLAESELYTVSEISQDLIKEVMDSSFISAKTKQLYCENLASLQMDEAVSQVKEDREYALGVKQAFNKQAASTIAVALSVMTGFLSSLIYLASQRLEISLSDGLSALTGTSISILLPLLASLLAAFVALVTLKVEKRRITSPEEMMRDDVIRKIRELSDNRATNLYKSYYRTDHIASGVNEKK